MSTKNTQPVLNTSQKYVTYHKLLFYTIPQKYPFSKPLCSLKSRFLVDLKNYHWFDRGNFKLFFDIEILHWLNRENFKWLDELKNQFSKKNWNNSVFSHKMSANYHTTQLNIVKMDLKILQTSFKDLTIKSEYQNSQPVLNTSKKYVACHKLLFYNIPQKYPVSKPL